MKPWIPVAAIALALAPLLVVHPVRISGKSMAPTLKDGELRLALWGWASPAPRRGQVWLVEGPYGPTVKRVMGLPGETVEWMGPDLWVDGQRVEEPWVTHPERDLRGRTGCGRGYLVMGDNRPDSQDGRSWGPLPARAMRGRML